MKGKIESLEEKLRCADRKETKDKVCYCESFVLDCPYIDKTRYIQLGMMAVHPCTYFKTFDGFQEKEK